jgi:hypothetical protein
MRKVTITMLLAGALAAGVTMPATAAPVGSSAMPLRVTFDASALGAGDTQMTTTWLVPYPGHPGLADSDTVLPLLLKTVVDSAPVAVPEPQGTTANWTLKRGMDNYAASMVCVESPGAKVCVPLVFHVSSGTPAANTWHVRAPLCAQGSGWSEIPQVVGKRSTPWLSLGNGVGLAVFEKSASELRVAAVPLADATSAVTACT